MTNEMYYLGDTQLREFGHDRTDIMLKMTGYWGKGTFLLGNQFQPHGD